MNLSATPAAAATPVQWSAPCYGVSHLLINKARASMVKRQYTASEYPSGVQAVVIDTPSFGAITQGWFASVEEARAFLEAQAKQNGDYLPR